MAKKKLKIRCPICKKGIIDLSKSNICQCGAVYDKENNNFIAPKGKNENKV